MKSSRLLFEGTGMPQDGATGTKSEFNKLCGETDELLKSERWGAWDSKINIWFGKTGSAVTLASSTNCKLALLHGMAGVLLKSESSRALKADVGYQTTSFDRVVQELPSCLVG
jgi:hypothetical protein